MSNLREALRDIVFKCAGGIGDMGDTEVDAILATVSKHLPEKRTAMMVTHCPYCSRNFPTVEEEYNTAITEMEKTLEGKQPCPMCSDTGYTYLDKGKSFETRYNCICQLTDKGSV